MHKIFVKGYVGTLGTKVLIENKYEELSKHFSKEYLRDLHNTLEEFLKDGEIPSLNLLNNVFDKELIFKGGVLASLWKICDKNKWGLRYNLNKIPILQGTIEISNYFDLNPYRLLTNNSELIAIDDNDVDNVNIMVRDFCSSRNIFIPFIEIGETNALKKRVRVDGETEAFLTKDYKDEIDKIIPKYSKEL